jgi:hypothetical protein
MTRARGLSINELFILAMLKTINERGLPNGKDLKKLIERRYSGTAKVFRMICEIAKGIDMRHVDLVGTRTERLQLKHEVRIKSLCIIQRVNMLSQLEFMVPFIDEATANFRSMENIQGQINTKARFLKILLLLDIDLQRLLNLQRRVVKVKFIAKMMRRRYVRSQSSIDR